MSSRSAATLVLITGGLMVTYAALDAKNGTVTADVTYKRIYSSFLATAALGIAADFVPEIVGPFAILIIVAAWAKHKGALGGLLGSSGQLASGAAGTSGTTATGASSSTAAGAATGGSTTSGPINKIGGAQ